MKRIKLIVLIWLTLLNCKIVYTTIRITEKE